MVLLVGMLVGVVVGGVVVVVVGVVVGRMGVGRMMMEVFGGLEIWC